MKKNWEDVLSLYVDWTISPDGRDTFESTQVLSDRIFDFASIKTGDMILDLGCGWGKSLQPFVSRFRSVIGVDISKENIARARAVYAQEAHVSFMNGCIQDLELPKNSADLIISSLVLHQVNRADWSKLFKAVAQVMKVGGEMIMADEVILFDPEAYPERFDEVYRYLLEKTTPADVYEHHIKPYLKEGHIYTWQDMKENTPPEYWFYSVEDLKSTLKNTGLELTDVQEITPFFGLLKIRHQTIS